MRTAIFPSMIGLAATALLAGCATYADLKTSQPIATRVVKGQMAQLADCYVDKRMNGYIENYQRLELDGGLQLIVRDVPLWGPPSLLYQLSFSQADPEMTRIELRVGIKPVLNVFHANDTIIEMAAGCAR
jgi:hypothetical protein